MATDTERADWVQNHEGLYQWWLDESKSLRRATGKGISVRDFARQHREEIDAVIEKASTPKVRQWWEVA